MRARVLKYAVGAALVALTLSGCYKVTQDLTLNEDDTVSGEMIFAFQEEYAEDASMGDLMGDLGEDDFVDGSVEEYNEDGYVGSRIIFNNEPLSQFTSEDLSITRSGDDFVVSGSMGSAEEYVEDAIQTLSVTFPGDVSEHNGTLSGTTVTWDAADGQFDVYAVGSATGGGAGGFGLIVLILVLVFGLLLFAAVVGVIIWLVVRSNKKPAEAPAAPAADAPAAPAAKAPAKKAPAKKAPAKKAAPKKTDS